jgi:hypothetical protein
LGHDDGWAIASDGISASMVIKVHGWFMIPSYRFAI